MLDPSGSWGVHLAMHVLPALPRTPPPLTTKLLTGSWFGLTSKPKRPGGVSNLLSEGGARVLALTSARHFLVAVTFTRQGNQAGDLQNQDEE